ncbi:MAG TPA: hypothetical protein VHW45_20255 [Candidatus Sulfotelmatobacter sp.]|jgi:hypothetical protein|nr:hypothetical protein [Candidatus Sulfotelmatobacter sp.]
MTNILDQVARSSASAQFRPATPSEFLAMRLAHRLNDQAAVRHYTELAERYGDGQLLTAYRRIRDSGVHHDLGRAFHTELERLAGRNSQGNSNGTSGHRLASIRVERRAVAIALFAGEHLDSSPLVRQLSSDRDKALDSAAAFITRILDKRPFATAALEAFPEDEEVQRGQLVQILTGILTQRTVGIWRIPKRDVLAAFGHPPLRFRSQVREAMTSIFPEVNGSSGAPLIKDALALGLYCQIEHLLNL